MSDPRPPAVDPAQNGRKLVAWILGLVGVVVLVLVLIFAVVGCGKNEDSSAIPTSTAAPARSSAQTTTTSAAPPTTVTTDSAAAGAGLRSQTCNDLLPMLQSMRDLGGDAAVAKAVDETLTWIPQQPTWGSLSEADRKATLDGVRDAGAGTCK